MNPKIKSRSFRVVLLLVLAMVADAAYASVRGGLALYEARTSLLSAVNSLRDGDAATARSDFTDAEGDLATANSSFGHPGYRVLERMPFIGSDARAARILAEAADGLARSGGGGVEVVEGLGGDGGDIGSSLLEGGRVRLDPLHEAALAMDPLLEEVVEADAILRRAPRPRFGIVRDAVLLARARLDGAVTALRRGRAVAGAAQELFGGESTKRYLLALQAPSEARGSGGLFGLFAVLTIRDGAIDIGRIMKPPSRLVAASAPAITPVDAPRWFVDKYEAEASLWNSSEVNLSPHFPTVAEALLKMFEQISELDLHGVVAIDPHAFASLLAASGPIETPQLGTVTSENAARLIMRDSYTRITDQQQGRNLGALLDEFFARLRSGDVAGPAFLSGVGQAASHGRLKFYVRDGDSAEALATARADGDFSTAGPMQQFVWHNSDSISKVDWFLHRTLETVVRLGDDGSAKVTTRILLENKAPDGPKSLLIGGQGEGYTPGQNRMRLDVLMPKGAVLDSFKDSDTAIEANLADEAGYPSAWYRLIMSPMSQRLIEVTYEVPEAYEPEDETFAFTLYPHAAVRPDEYLLTIYAPEGSELRTADSFDGAAEFVQVTGRLEEPVVLEVELVD